MYAKVFAQIFDSSIADDYELRHFFMDLLVLADSDGVVDMTHSAIAARTRIPIEKVKECIARLEQPDFQSRTPDDEGRRIKKLDDHRDWGWVVINYDRFRAIGNDLHRRIKTKERVSRFRAKLRTDNNVTPCNADVTGLYPSASASVQGDRGNGERVLTTAERIEKEKEIGRIDKFVGNRKPSDYAKESEKRLELQKLIARRKLLTQQLGLLV